MEYFSVSQYAKIVGKDTGNIRKMLISGRLDGKKIGNQWVIPSSAEYPSDARIKTGKYRNWRKKPIVWINNPLLMRNLVNMSERIYEVYGSTLDKIVVYGSYARGEETDESDVDIAVILSGDETEDMHDKMTDIVVDYEIDTNRVLSVITIESQNYNVWKKTLPFYKNIDKEGTVIWKAR